MTDDHSRKRTEFVARWPVQGIACFRSQESELILSDVYWRWIVQALQDEGDGGQRLAFVDVILDGFPDPSDFVEEVPITPKVLELLRRVAPSAAPSFDLVQPADGCPRPSAEQILAEFVRLVEEALPSGTMELEIG